MAITLFATGVIKTTMNTTLALLVPMNQLPELMVSTLVFSLIGLVVFAIAFWIMEKVMPFSMRKEIEEDHNVALGVIIASIIIGIGLIISAAVHG